MPKFDLEYAIDTVQFYRVTVEADTLDDAIAEGHEVVSTGPRQLVDSSEQEITLVEVGDQR
jgi:hypothetical protein